MLSHKIRLNPNNEQITYFKKACGISRFTYNWALDKWSEMYKKGEKVNAFKLKKIFNSIKKEKFPWIYEITKTAPERSFVDINSAFSRFFKKIGKYPVFKKKGKKDSFYISNDKFIVNGKRIKIPKLGWVRMREELRFSGKILSATVSCRADQWYASINVDNNRVVKKQDNSIGIDLGVKDLAILSTGERFTSPKPHKINLLKLRRLNKSLSRKVKGSKNWRKAVKKLSKLHLRIANIRNDYIHKLTTYLTNRFGTICIENLNVSGMIKNHKLARAISDMGFYEFRRQLEYKANKLNIISRWFPSTKMCNECGVINDNLTLSTRNWNCDCGAFHDRDVNAALNILAVGLTV